MGNGILSCYFAISRDGSMTSHPLVYHSFLVFFFLIFLAFLLSVMKCLA